MLSNSTKHISSFDEVITEHYMNKKMFGEPYLKVKSRYFATFAHFFVNIFAKSIALVTWQASQVHRVHWIEIFIHLHGDSS